MDSPEPPAWASRQVMVFEGQHDTHINTGEDYHTLPLGSLWSVEPSALPKERGLAFVPSTYCGYDGRKHEAQREKGSFAALVGDVDTGNHPADEIADALGSCIGSAPYLIYSSAHAREGDMRWRMIVPLAEPVPFAAWHDAQTALFDLLEAAGVKMDYALARAGQPVYLPNVPSTHAKTGAPLRGDDGRPLYFQRRKVMSEQGLDLASGALNEQIAIIEGRRATDERLRQRIRAESERKRRSRPNDGLSVIDAFNRDNDLAALLNRYGYRQSPRNPADWRSELQTGPTYATRVMDGGKWVSLSASDAAAGIGEAHAAGCYGDAFDLFVHYEHSGDVRSAWRQLGEERDAAAATDRGRDPYDGSIRQPEPQETQEQSQDGLHAAERAEHSKKRPQGASTHMEPGFHPVSGDTIPDPESEPLPFEVHDAGDFKGKDVPRREFMLEGWEPRRSTVYVTGLGATGKSLLYQQRMTCSAAGLSFMGVGLRPGISLYLTCEDDMKELHMRQAAINDALGVTWDQLQGKLYLISWKGLLNKELCTFSQDGKMKPSARWRQLVRLIRDLGVTHLVLDNVAHLYAGNENIRNQVAAFLGLLDRLAEEINGVVVLLGHPNKEGAEFSGSTGWENQVRSRVYLSLVKDPDGSIPNPDARQLTNSKPNYAPRGQALEFVWHRWAFVREDELSQDAAKEFTQTIQASGDNQIFLKCLAEMTRQKRAVSDKRSPTYAPTVFARMPESKRIGKSRLEKAFERLWRVGRLERAELWRGPDRKPVYGLREILQKGAGNGAGNTVRETRETPQETAENRAGDAGETHTVDTTYQSGAAFEAAAPENEGEGVGAC